jgi:hypothetical protein
MLTIERTNKGLLVANGQPLAFFDTEEEAEAALLWRGTLVQAAAHRVYLIHSDKKIGREQTDTEREENGHGPRVRRYDGPHASHYVGYTTGDVDGRLEKHLRGYGCPYTRLLLQGGGYLVRVWFAGYLFENYLKNSYKKTPNLCPVCNPAAAGYLPYPGEILA